MQCTWWYGCLYHSCESGSFPRNFHAMTSSIIKLGIANKIRGYSCSKIGRIVNLTYVILDINSITIVRTLQSYKSHFKYRQQYCTFQIVFYKKEFIIIHNVYPVRCLAKIYKPFAFLNFWLWSLLKITNISPKYVYKL